MYARGLQLQVHTGSGYYLGPLTLCSFSRLSGFEWRYVTKGAEAYTSEEERAACFRVRILALPSFSSQLLGNAGASGTVRRAARGMPGSRPEKHGFPRALPKTRGRRQVRREALQGGRGAVQGGGA